MPSGKTRGKHQGSTAASLASYGPPATLPSMISSASGAVVAKPVHSVDTARSPAHRRHFGTVATRPARPRGGVAKPQRWRRDRNLCPVGHVRREARSRQGYRGRRVAADLGAGGSSRLKTPGWINKKGVIARKAKSCSTLRPSCSPRNWGSR
jgi:hypothetical protein